MTRGNSQGLREHNLGSNMTDHYLCFPGNCCTGRLQVLDDESGIMEQAEHVSLQCVLQPSAPVRRVWCHVEAEERRSHDHDDCDDGDYVGRFHRAAGNVLDQTGEMGGDFGCVLNSRTSGLCLRCLIRTGCRSGLDGGRIICRRRALFTR